MSYTMMRRKTPKNNSTSPFFLFIISGLALLPVIILVVSSPVGFVAAEEQKPIYSNLSEILTIPVVQTEVLIKDAHQKVGVAGPKAVQKTFEAYLKIPKIGVNAAIKEMTVTSDGAMAVPNNRVDVGWFSYGTHPGETGSAVIGGHNEWNSGTGVFVNLDQLEKGDVLSVVDANGISTFFVVKYTRTFDATDADTGIFESENGIHLNLITCSGDWNPKTKSYTKRLVIFTDIVQNINEITAVPTQIP